MIGRGPRTVLLAAGRPAPRAIASGKHELSLAKSTDEAVISTARAVAAAGLHLAMLDDASFAPLVVQIATDYMRPRHAEEPPGPRSDGEPRQPFLTLITQRSPSRQRRAAPWATFGQQLGVLGDDAWTLEQLLANRSPVAAILIGGGRAVSVLRQLRRLAPLLPIYTFAQCAVEPVDLSDGRSVVRPTKHSSLRVIDTEIDARLIALRSEASEQRTAHQEATTERSEFVPYALFAQRLVAVLNEESDELVP